MARIIEEEVVQKIVNYLATRPYAEVFPIMPTLMNLPSLDGPTPPPAMPPISPPTEVPTPETPAPTMPPAEPPADSPL